MRRATPAPGPPAKSDLLPTSQKYQRRWFVLTAESLTYAKDPQDMGRRETFGIRDLRSIRLVDEWRIEVRWSGCRHEV